jgi:hypothetical protein
VKALESFTTWRLTNWKFSDFKTVAPVSLGSVNEGILQNITKEKEKVH